MDLASAEEHRIDRTAQLSLLSPEELPELRRPSASRPQREGGTRSPETAKERKARRPSGDAVQDRLPGF